MTDRDAVRRALFLAIEWERSLIGGLNERHPEQKAEADRCRANIKAFEGVLDRRYGGDRFPAPYGGASITVAELLERGASPRQFDPVKALQIRDRSRRNAGEEDR